MWLILLLENLLHRYKCTGMIVLPVFGIGKETARTFLELPGSADVAGKFIEKGY